MVRINNKVKKQRLQSAAELLLVIILLVVLNILAQFTHARFDLTEDKRYSLGNQTKELLHELDDVVFFRVYLDGNLPPGMRRLQGSVLDMLREFRSIAGDKIQYRVIDPNNIEDSDERSDLHQQLRTLGLEPINLQVADGGGSRQQVVFPGAIATYGGREKPVTFLQQQMGRHSDEVIQSSIISVEYQLANSIRQLRFTEQKRIAIIEGHGQLPDYRTASIEDALSEYYEVERVHLPSWQVGKLERFDVAIMPRPTERMLESEKYKIDQFIMKGGRMLWLIDKLAADMDSLDRSGIGFTYDYDLNLEDQLFHYGVRVNYNLVQDLRSHQIPLLRDLGDGRPMRDFRPWPFFPIVMPASDHPIVNNLNAILFRFPSSLDTVGDPSIRKEVLLKSSPYTRIMPHPVRINLQSAGQELNPNLFNHEPQALAVLLEGEFSSLYDGRLAERTLQDERYGEFTAKSPKNRMIVVSDGYVIRNEISGQNQIYPLGYDRFTNQHFGNKDFILNCIDYLIDDSGLIELRGKDIQLRLLDRSRARAHKVPWQIANMVIPVLIVIVFGMLYNYIRKRRYAT